MHFTAKLYPDGTMLISGARNAAKRDRHQRERGVYCGRPSGSCTTAILLAEM